MVLLSARRQAVSHGAGFWIAAGAFLIVMAYSTVPTPLWALYQQRDGFSTFAVTIAFAAYAVGVAVSLFLAGHLGDTLGRRRILLPAVALELASAVLFLLWPALPGLILARLISGLGIGMLTATITAHILELHLTARPGAGVARGQIVATAANIGGFGVGALLSGALAEWIPAPLVTPFVVFLVLLALALVGVGLVPETADVPAVRPAYRPQRVRVPHDARGRFYLAGGIAFAAFAVLGLFTSLVPGFVSGQLHITSRAVAGSVVFVAFAAAVVGQIALRTVSLRTQVGLGAGLLVIGIVMVTVVVAGSGSLGWFFAGGVLGGGGAGVLFKAALAVAGSLASAAHRGEVLAGIFLAGYIGLAVPVVGLGVATLSVSLTAALVGFTAVIVLVALGAALPLVKALRA
ncbi:MFS transporter [Actinoplanes sp. NBRC 103695]|uniref:MFS transporter n=1 Tax=Actinoplanes sp. NBRC 103695 TaxID=3032202 RepID=UPI00249FC930|nr:MFS transporter [Actinoplanes sp. NBRC 103695]GLZ00207.1 MFS transporter [Actinoplanes sp. NBRC 103695]